MRIWASGQYQGHEIRKLIGAYSHFHGLNNRELSLKAEMLSAGMILIKYKDPATCVLVKVIGEA